MADEPSTPLLQLVEKMSEQNPEQCAERFYMNAAKQLEGLYERFSLVGNVVHSAHYVAGKLEGLTKLYDEASGELTQEANFMGGALSGEFKAYKNGILQVKGLYAAGKTQGPMELYYEDGSLLLKQYFEAGKLHGPYEYYHQEGTVLGKRCLYVKGKEEGECFEYYPSGKLLKKTHYQTGKLHGEYLMYTPDGKLHEKKFYKAGKEVPESEWDEELKRLAAELKAKVSAAGGAKPA